MMIGGTDVMYREALAAPHTPYLQLQVWSGEELLIEDLPILAGNVSASLTSRVTRNLDVTVPGEFYPTDADDPLNPFGNSLRVFRGIEYGDGSRHAWPVFRGRINSTVLQDGERCVLHAIDRAGEVQENGLTIPGNSQPGSLVSDEIKRLIADGVPDARFGESDSFEMRVPVLSWQYDRAGACDEMATALGAFWYALADGDFVIRRYPWTVRRDPVVTFKDGAGGTVLTSSAARRRDSIYNIVVVTGERADGTLPVFAAESDINPDSPTNVDGTFGRRTLLRNLNTPTSFGAVQGAARQLLKRATAFTEAWSFNAVPDASLELGDPISLEVLDRKGITQVVASISMPLDVAGNMAVSCRAQVVDVVEGAE